MKLREYVNHHATGLASLVESGEVTPITGRKVFGMTVANSRCHFSTSSNALEPTSHSRVP